MHTLKIEKNYSTIIGDSAIFRAQQGKGYNIFMIRVDGVCACSHFVSYSYKLPSFNERTGQMSAFSIETSIGYIYKLLRYHLHRYHLQRATTFKECKHI